MVCEFVLTEPCLWAVGLMSLVSGETNRRVWRAVSEVLEDVSIFCFNIFILVLFDLV